MPTTMDQVRAVLTQEEIDYPGAAAKLGAAALPHLLQIVGGSDVMLASKATYLAGQIEDPTSDQVLNTASNRTEPVIRVAAGSAAATRSVPPAQIIQRLLEDTDVGVRKAALRTVERRSLHTLKTRVQDVAVRDPEPALRTLASQIASRL